jgi:hypothetical protein
MGDILQLRQLWVDGAGNITQVPMQVANPEFPHTRYEYKSWTGVQHDAVVCSVNRAQETVYLMVDGLPQTYTGQSMGPIMVNVMFPIKQRMLRAQHVALAYVDAELKITETLRRPDLPTDADDDFDDFDLSLAVKLYTKLTEQQVHGSCNE